MSKQVSLPKTSSILVNASAKTLNVSLKQHFAETELQPEKKRYWIRATEDKTSYKYLVVSLHFFHSFF